MAVEFLFMKNVKFNCVILIFMSRRMNILHYKNIFIGGLRNLGLMMFSRKNKRRSVTPSKKSKTQSSYQMNLDVVSNQKEYGMNFEKAHLKLGNVTYVFEDSKWITDGSNPMHSASKKSFDKHSIEVQQLVHENSELKLKVTDFSNIAHSTPKKSPDKPSIEQLVDENNVLKLKVTDGLNLTHSTPEKPSDKRSIEVQQLLDENNELKLKVTEDTNLIHLTPKKSSDKHSILVQQLVDENNMLKLKVEVLLLLLSEMKLNAGDFETLPKDATEKNGEGDH